MRSPPQHAAEGRKMGKYVDVCGAELGGRHAPCGDAGGPASGAMRSAILATTTCEQRINKFSQFLHDGSANSTYMAVYIRICDLPRLKEDCLALITKLRRKK
jgi:hypothetical protein